MQALFTIIRAQRRCAALVLGLLLSAYSVPSAFAQTPSESAGELVRTTVANELKPGADSFMFRSRKQASWGTQSHVYVQTKEGTAGILVAVNDKSLDASQRKAELDRLDYLVRNPVEIRRKQKREREDADRVARIVRALPAAFLYQYDGVEQSRSGIGNPGDELVRLKFQPNPKFDPPSRVEQVLTGMQGIVLIDATKHRIAKIDGTLYKDVSFGWGFFGHLDKGGTFQVDQGEAGSGGWEITRMGLNFTGKILIFKNLVINSSEVFSDFQKVPDNLTFADAVALLKKEAAASSSPNAKQ
jgi:hypothetical protein